MARKEREKYIRTSLLRRLIPGVCKGQEFCTCDGDETEEGDEGHDTHTKKGEKIRTDKQVKK